VKVSHKSSEIAGRENNAKYFTANEIGRAVSVAFLFYFFVLLIVLHPFTH